MAEIIRMPLLSDTMEEGTIVAWNKKVGDKVESGDVLAEVETDKAVMEVESYFDGTLIYVGVKEGDSVPIDGIIAIIGEEGDDVEALLKGASQNGQAKEESTSAEVKKEEVVTDSPATAQGDAAGMSQEHDKRIKASPLAKKMAEDAGISLVNVKGTGDAGRVIKRDILAHIESAPKVEPVVNQPATKPAPVAEPEPEKPNVPAFTFTGEDTYEEVKLSNMRKTIARRLGESKFTAPHFYLTIDVDMAKAWQARKQMNEIAPTKISFNDIVVKSCAAALHQHPAVNASWTGETIRYNKHVHIGVAVAVDEGLLVPVIRNADLKTLSQINVEVKELAGKARNRRLTPEQMSGNTFTVSNLGMFGIEEFTAIINPPDSCILAVGAILDKAVVVDGEIKVGKRMKITLSCDHRVVDGATGAKFLATLKAILEDPIRMLV